MYVISVGGSLRGVREQLMEFSNGSACEIAAVAYCFPAAPPRRRSGARGYGASVNQLYFYYISYIILLLLSF